MSTNKAVGTTTTTATESQAGPSALAIMPEGKLILNAILEGKSADYTPLGETKKISLTIPLVKQYLCVPTASGKTPTDQDCVRYIMMCQQRGLNPWAQDCYLLGYDTNKGPQFSMVVAIQALLKRAELARSLDAVPVFDGIDSGVVVERKYTVIEEVMRPDGELAREPVEKTEIVERVGDLLLKGDVLIGGWSKVYRKDRSRSFYQRLQVEVYRRDTKIWRTDAAGMICKCAEAAALRQAFPSDIGGMYLASEIEAFAEDATAKLLKSQQTGQGGHINLDVLSGRAPGQKPAADSPAADHAASGEHSVEVLVEGVDAMPPDEPSQQVDDVVEQQQDQGEETSDEESGTASHEDLEALLTTWRFEVDQCKTHGALEKLAEDCQINCPSPLKSRVFAYIAARRTALSQPGAGKKPAAKQNNLPGA